jgi:prevent-host-death family protein
MERVVSATEARIHFGELMRRAAETGEPIVVERDGKPVVVLLHVDEYERLLKGQQQVDWRDLLRRAHAKVREDLGGRPLPPPEQVLGQMREERDEQLLALR